jgi:hypothetical protein
MSSPVTASSTLWRELLAGDESANDLIHGPQASIHHPLRVTEWPILHVCSSLTRPILQPWHYTVGSCLGEHLSSILQFLLPLSLSVMSQINLQAYVRFLHEGHRMFAEAHRFLCHVINKLVSLTIFHRYFLLRYMLCVRESHCRQILYSMQPNIILLLITCPYIYPCKCLS